MFDDLPDQHRKLMPMTRVILTVTAHTDIRVFYPKWKDQSRRTEKVKTKNKNTGAPFYRDRRK